MCCLVFLFSLISLSFVSAYDTSDTTTNFTLAGCSIPGQSGKLAVDKCSEDGSWFCDNDIIRYYTLSDSSGCSRGLTSGLSEGSFDNVIRMNICCPAGYFCNITSLECDLRPMSCEEHQDIDSCEQQDSCIWVDSSCYDPNDPSLSCGIYKTETSCEEDEWNMGQEGVGTDRCGTFTDEGQTIPTETCACEWDSGDDDCKFVYEPRDEIHGGVPDSFKCLKEFSSGDCINGIQEISWVAAHVSLITGYTPSNPELIAAGCKDGSQNKNCGQAVVKLPGFGLINVFLVLLGLGVFYLVFKENL